MAPHQMPRSGGEMSRKYIIQPVKIDTRHRRPVFLQQLGMSYSGTGESLCVCLGLSLGVSVCWDCRCRLIPHNA